LKEQAARLTKKTSRTVTESYEVPNSASSASKPSRAILARQAPIPLTPLMPFESPLLCKASISISKRDVAGLVGHLLACSGLAFASFDFCGGREQHFDGDLFCRQGRGEQIGCESSTELPFPKSITCYRPLTINEGPRDIPTIHAISAMLALILTFLPSCKPFGGRTIVRWYGRCLRYVEAVT
jgi:hypothetical protein